MEQKENPEIGPHECSQHIFGKEIIQWEKVFFSPNGAGITGHTINLDTDTSFTKVTSKWVTDLSVKCKTFRR